jgi:hypothetical protein
MNRLADTEMSRAQAEQGPRVRGPYLSAAEMNRLERQLSPPNAIDRADATPIQAGYLLGIQYVLQVLRNGS